MQKMASNTNIAYNSEIILNDIIICEITAVNVCQFFNATFCIFNIEIAFIYFIFCFFFV